MLAPPTRGVRGGRLLALALLLGVATAIPAQSCGGTQDPVEASLPQTIFPSQITEVTVDPVFGDDLQAITVGAPFRTVTAAAAALGYLVATQGPVGGGIVRLKPGVYGNGPGMNGEVFPIVVSRGVSIIGEDALSVVFQGDAHAANANSFPVLDAATGITSQKVPVFVFGTGATEGFEHTLLARVTIVDAAVGVLVTGAGEVSPTVAESLFARCEVGMCVDGQPGLPGQRHRPVSLWNTFGDCEVGFLRTGSVPSLPAIVNCVFKSTRDLEGVPCNAVRNSAFEAARSNGSPHVVQPHANPMPVLDLGTFGHRDLFLGARAPSQPMTGPLDPFLDWRLTWTTTAPVAPNLLNTVGLPFDREPVGNGTWVRLTYPGFLLGETSSEGTGTYGPTSSPLGGGGTTPTGGSVHVGYRGGSGFVVGGTLPGTRRFGTGAGGRLYDVIDITFPPGVGVFLIAGVVNAGPLWPQWATEPAGLLAEPLRYSLSARMGGQHIDLSHGFTDYTSLVTGLANDNHGVLNLGLPPSMPATSFALQAVLIHPTQGFFLSDAQAFQVGL